MRWARGAMWSGEVEVGAGVLRAAQRIMRMCSCRFLLDGDEGGVVGE